MSSETVPTEKFHIAVTAPNGDALGSASCDSALCVFIDALEQEGQRLKTAHIWSSESTLQNYLLTLHAIADQLQRAEEAPPQILGAALNNVLIKFHEVIASLEQPSDSATDLS